MAQRAARDLLWRKKCVVQALHDTLGASDALEIPMRQALIVFCLLAAASFGPARASDPVPEVKRPPAIPQPVGKLHTLRNIPEACARIQGRFTGDAADPYAFAIVSVGGRCQPRARLVDAAKAHPSAETGWVFNDLVKVPSAECPARQAVVRVWRQDLTVAPPKADAQGTSRIYLKKGLEAARKGQLQAIPSYAVAMSLEGKSCD